MARAKAEGRHVARPPLPLERQEKIRSLAGAGLSLREIAREVGVSKPTVIKYLRKATS